MSFHWLAAVCGAGALASLLLGVYWLSGGSVVGRVLKRGLGVLSLVVGGFLGLGAWDLYSYERDGPTPIATLHFTKLAPRSYQVELRSPGADSAGFVLNGDQWQLDARLLRPSGLLRRWWRTPYYRLERISGRYERAADELAQPRSVYALASEPQLDVGQWLQRLPSGWRPMQVGYGSATFLPMADGAEFVVYIDGRGLSASAANGPARSAVERWFGGG